VHLSADRMSLPPFLEHFPCPGSPSSFDSRPPHRLATLLQEPMTGPSLPQDTVTQNRDICLSGLAVAFVDFELRLLMLILCAASSDTEISAHVIRFSGVGQLFRGTRLERVCECEWPHLHSEDWTERRFSGADMLTDALFKHD
jgi:hypothetical protein